MRLICGRICDCGSSRSPTRLGEKLPYLAAYRSSLMPTRCNWYAAAAPARPAPITTTRASAALPREAAREPEASPSHSVPASAPPATSSCRRVTPSARPSSSGGSATAAACATSAVRRAAMACSRNSRASPDRRPPCMFSRFGLALARRVPTAPARTPGKRTYAAAVRLSAQVVDAVIDVDPHAVIADQALGYADDVVQPAIA